MGSDQSTPVHASSSGLSGGSRPPGSGHAPLSSPEDRQDSLCSSDLDGPSQNDDEVPYVSYTVNRPIGGDSPKKKAGGGSSASAGAAGGGGGARSKSFLSSRGSSSRRPRPQDLFKNSTLVVVNEDRGRGGAVASSSAAPDDPELARLRDLPAFLPVMRGSLNGPQAPKDPDILERLDHRGLLALCQRYQTHLHACADKVSRDQAILNGRVKQVEQTAQQVTAHFAERQKDLSQHADRLGGVREMSQCLSRCHLLLNENIEQMEILNNMLPPDDRLEPFVWTTG